MAYTKILWRVQVRKSRAHKWVNKGLFETRKAARLSAQLFREHLHLVDKRFAGPFGLGNTRVVRYEKGAK